MRSTLAAVVLVSSVAAAQPLPSCLERWRPSPENYQDWLLELLVLREEPQALRALMFSPYFPGTVREIWSVPIEKVIDSDDDASLARWAMGQSARERTETERDLLLWQELSWRRTVPKDPTRFSTAIVRFGSPELVAAWSCLEAMKDLPRTVPVVLAAQWLEPVLIRELYSVGALSNLAWYFRVHPGELPIALDRGPFPFSD